MFCLYCGKRIAELHGRPPADEFCSFAHRAEYYRRMKHAPEPSQRLAGFKPPILGIGLEIRQTTRFQQSVRELRLPGAWGLAIPAKRGIRMRATFRDMRVEAPPAASSLSISRGSEAILTRIANWVVQHPGEPGWNVRPRLIPPISVLGEPLLTQPFSRPVFAREDSLAIRLERDTNPGDFPEITLGILPQFPVLDLKPEKTIEPVFAAPREDAGASIQELPHWVRYRQLTMPLDRSPQIPSLQTSGHVTLPPAFADSQTHVAESGLTAMPVRAKRHADATVPAILNPGPTSLPWRDIPSRIGPKPSPADAHASALLDVPAGAHAFAASLPFADSAVPDAKTDAALPGPFVWFAIRVPSPCVLETPTPADMSKRLHYIHGARHICTTGIPAEVVWYPAGLPAGEKRIAYVTPDTLGETAFLKSTRPLSAKTVPEIAEPLPPVASPIERTLPPIDQRAILLPRNTGSGVEAFPMAPAVIWTATTNWTGATNEAVPEERGPLARDIRPVPDSPDFLPFADRAQAEPGWEFRLASSTGASFAIGVARACGPEPAPIAIPDTSHRPWRRTVGMSRSERLPQPVRLAPALAPFRAIARLESMQSSFAEDLRDRIFKPILTASLGIRLLPPGIETIGSTLRESPAFAPLDFRWQRSRKVRDRGAPWKTPSGIGTLPGCEIPQWPGPLEVQIPRPAKPGPIN